MTTPDEFLERVLATANEAALLLAGTPPDLQASWLRGFADRTRTQWRLLFAPHLSTSDVDGMVDDLVARVKAKRDEIERHGAGRA